MRARRSFFIVCARHLARLMLAVAVLAHPLGAQTYMQPIDTTPGSAVKIQVFNLYGEVPARGYVPLKVTITNSTNEEGVWTITSGTQYGFGGGAQNFTTEMQCREPAHAEDTFEVLAPLPSEVQVYMRMLNVSVNGPGVKEPDISWQSTGGGYGPMGGNTLVVGLSTALSTAYGSKLRDYYQNPKTYAQNCLLPKLDPDLMPEDWRGYLGFDLMVFTSADWLNLTAAVRAAVLQWVASGGDLRLIAGQDGGLSLPPRLGEHYGAGAILLFTQADLDNYDADKFGTVYKRPNERFLFNFNYQPPRWLAARFHPGSSGPSAPPAPNSFAASVPSIKSKYILVSIIIVAFGVLVGPVNLFVFCRGASRSRLLWVTPLLSLGAAALLLAFIILSEGIGGRGIYYRVTQLAPDGKFAVESQVNASVTGMLFKREFHFAEPAWLTVSDSNLSVNDPPHGTFSQFGSRYWGDWFGSRQAQTLTAQAVVPTRAAVRLESGPATGNGTAPPSLRSEYNGQLNNLYYLDAAGIPWKTALVSNGQVVRLQPSTLAEIATVWQSNVINAPLQLRDKLGKLMPEPGTFFALGDGSDAPLQPDLATMSWISYRHLVLGPVAPAQ